MSTEIADRIQEFVDGDQPVRIAGYNPFRSFINIWAGESALWYGSRNVTSGGIGNKIPAGGMATLDATKSEQNKGEVWVIREALTSGLCEFSEEN